MWNDPFNHFHHMFDHHGFGGPVYAPAPPAPAPGFGFNLGSSASA